MITDFASESNVIEILKQLLRKPWLGSFTAVRVAQLFSYFGSPYQPYIYNPDKLQRQVQIKEAGKVTG